MLEHKLIKSKLLTTTMNLSERTIALSLLSASLCLLVASLVGAHRVKSTKTKQTKQIEYYQSVDWLCVLNLPIPMCLAQLSRGDVAGFKRDNCCTYIQYDCPEEVFCYFESICEGVEKCKNPIVIPESEIKEVLGDDIISLNEGRKYTMDKLDKSKFKDSSRD